MPTTDEFERAAEIERQIEQLVSTLFEEQIKGHDVSSIQNKLDQLSSELAELRTSDIALAA